MIKKRTTFVLGAGASFPYGFPTGASLASGIVAAIADQRNDLGRQVRDFIQDDAAIEQFVDDFRASEWTGSMVALDGAWRRIQGSLPRFDRMEPNQKA